MSNTNYLILTIKPSDLEDEELALSIDLFGKVLQEIYPGQEKELAYKNKLNLKYLTRLILLTHDGKYIGRAAIYFNPGIQHEGKRTFLIGNYECSGDNVAAKKIMQEIEAECYEQDIEYVIGPMDGSTWNSYRFCTERKTDPFFMEPFHKDYYPKQFSDNGFTPLADYISSKQTEIIPLDERTKEKIKEFSKSGINFRKINLEDFENELKKVYPLCVKTFTANYLYTPLSQEEFIEMYLSAKHFLNENLILLGEHNNKVIGFIFCIDDLLNKKEKGFIVKTLARDSDPMYKGTGNILSALITDYALKNNYQYLIHALMIEDNASVKVSENFFGKIISRYRLYIKKI